jgi:hypothetical protein
VTDGVGISVGLLLVAVTFRICGAPGPELMPDSLMNGEPVGGSIVTVGAMV